MSKLRLYPPVKVERKDFTKSKVIMVPNQSLTLRDIIQRFIRKESMPIGRDGIYNETLGDLEKIAREDITERHERADALRQTRTAAVKKYNDLQAAKNQAPAVIPPEGSQAVPAAS